MTGSAFVFINVEQAAQFGHVAWAFQLDNDRYCFGSTDHLWRREYPQWHPIELIRYFSVRPNDNNDHWMEMGNRNDMLRIMWQGPHIRYHFYKEMPVGEPNSAAAMEKAKFLASNGWHLLYNNCVHQTFDVLTAYGATTLTNPYKFGEFLPKVWFEKFPAESVALGSA